MKLEYCEMLGLGEAPVNKYRSSLHLNYKTFTSLKSFKTDPSQQQRPGKSSSIKISVGKKRSYIVISPQ